MEDILAVSLNKSYDENISKDDLKKITKKAWALDSKKVDKIKYIVGIKNGEIKSIYKVKKYKPAEIRYSFEVEEAESHIENAIKDTFDNTISFYGGNPIRYLNSEDLK